MSAVAASAVAARAVAARPLEGHPLRLRLALQLLGEGRTVELPVGGSSMRPLLAPGERVRVRPARAADARPGDVVVLTAGEGLLAHRLLYATGERVVTRGDDCAAADLPAPPAAVVGIIDVAPSPRALWAAVRALLRY